MAVIKKLKAVKIEQNHLLGIQDLSFSQVSEILKQAKTFVTLNKSSSKKNGYFVARSVFSKKECESFIKEAHKVCKIETVTSNIYRKSKKFLSLLKDKRILSIADSLLEWRVIPIGDIFFFSNSKSNKESGSVPHQDNYAQRAEYGAFMAVGLYFDEAIEENGALRVYPGSHKLGEIKSDPKPNWVYDKRGKIIKN